MKNYMISYSSFYNAYMVYSTINGKKKTLVDTFPTWGDAFNAVKGFKGV